MPSLKTSHNLQENTFFYFYKKIVVCSSGVHVTKISMLWCFFKLILIGIIILNVIEFLTAILWNYLLLNFTNTYVKLSNCVVGMYIVDQFLCSWLMIWLFFNQYRQHSLTRVFLSPLLSMYPLVAQY